MLMLPSSLLHLALLRLPCQILSPPSPPAPSPTPTLVVLLSPDTSPTLSCCSLPMGSSSAQASLISLPFLQPSKGDCPLPSLLPQLAPFSSFPSGAPRQSLCSRGGIQPCSCYKGKHLKAIRAHPRGFVLLPASPCY